MPVYEYVCMACEARFDRLQGLSDPEPDCPRCGERRVARQFSTFAAGRSAGDVAGGPSAGGCACGGACACS